MDNISNYDSKTENIVYITALESIMDKKSQTWKTVYVQTGGRQEFDVFQNEPLRLQNLVVKVRQNPVSGSRRTADLRLVLRSQKNYFPSLCNRRYREFLGKEKSWAMSRCPGYAACGWGTADGVVWRSNNEKKRLL
ncbi:MAG: hypothetical protein ACLTDV_00135 [Eubacterium sp.]